MYIKSSCALLRPKVAVGDAEETIKEFGSPLLDSHNDKGIGRDSLRATQFVGTIILNS